MSHPPSLATTDPLQRPPAWMYWPVAILLIACLGYAAFGSALTNDWISESLPTLHSTPSSSDDAVGTQRDGFAPLATASLQLQSRWTDSQNYTQLCHATILLLHLANALLIMAVLQQIFRVRLFSTATAALFVCLPMNTEVAVWQAAHSHALAFFFSMLTLLCFIRFVQLERRRARTVAYTLALVFAVAAMLSGRNALALPFLLMLFHLCYAASGDTLGAHARKVLLKFHYHIPFLLCFFWIGNAHLVASVDTNVTLGFGERMMAMAHIFPHYLSSFLWPGSLAPLYDIPHAGGLSVSIIVTLAALILIPSCALLVFNLNRAVFFAIGWFVISFLPYANLWPSGTLQSDRYIYAPSFAYCMLLGYLVTLIWYTAWNRTLMRCLATITILGTLGFNTMAARTYAGIWENEQTVWQHVLHRAPQVTEARFRLALSYLQKGQTYLARNELEQAMRWTGDENPLRLTIALQLSHIYMQQARSQSALTLLDAILKSAPDAAENHNDLVALSNLHQSRAKVLETMGILEYAYQDLEQAVTLARQIGASHSRTSTLKPALYSLGMLAAQVNQINVAETSLRRCLAIDSGNEFLPSNLRVGAKFASLLSKLERWDEAASLVETLLQNTTNDSKLSGIETRSNLWIALAAIQYSSGQTELGRASLQSCMDLDPKRQDTRFAIADFLLQHGLTDEAESVIREGFRYPEFITPGSNWLYDRYYREALHDWENPESAKQLSEHMAPLLTRAIALNTSDPRADVLYIQYLTAALKFQKAEDAWQRILPYIDNRPDLKADYAELYKLWGNRLWLDQNQTEALQKFERYLTVAPPETDLGYVQTLVNTLRRKTDSNRISEFLTPIETEFQNALAAPEVKQEEALQSVLRMFDAADEDLSRNPVILHRKASVLAAAQKQPEALQTLRECMKRLADPMDMPDVWFQAGRISFLMARFEDSLRDLRDYLNLTQWQSDNALPTGLMLYEIAKFYRGQENHLASAHAFDLALGLADLDKKYVYLYHELGIEWQQAKHADAALANLQTYLDRSGDNAKFADDVNQRMTTLTQTITHNDEQIKTANMEMKAGQLASAEIIIQTCLQDLPYHPLNDETLGDLETLRHKPLQAEEAYTTAIQHALHDSQVLLVHFKLAKLFAQRGDWGSVHRKIQRIQRQIPQDAPWRQEALDLLQQAKEKRQN